MAKKKNVSRKKQRKGTKARKIHQETAEQLGNQGGKQDMPKKQVATDENGRKMTVIMGGEAEMEKIWDRMQVTFAIQSQSSTISERLESVRSAIETKSTTSDQEQETFKKVEDEVEQLLGRMRDAVNANNRQAAQQGVQISDLVSVDLSLMEDLHLKEVVTGFELDLLKVAMSLNWCVSGLHQATQPVDPDGLDCVPLDNDRMRLRGG
ncbi:hypothetical protein CABS01_08939 [Colletotrichum abscissum]|uniref:Uncharacterized protein n=1 Tax=Colletotrichum abscissum TaxID=1671311 RepID=A0A9Q0ATJ7_9PEZI|nr:uncharacterized protein CABS01_08939 [Colletotrichum abscissum]KAI3530761.1 hypothetical protein CABS02_14412 [Colletotrichum abscissum]KAK1503550.1 hypothetical protein CABS01_08939 [Colletotrichum abscissum]